MRRSRVLGLTAASVVAFCACYPSSSPEVDWAVDEFLFAAEYRKDPDARLIAVHILSSDGVTVNVHGSTDHRVQLGITDVAPLVAGPESDFQVVRVPFDAVTASGSCSGLSRLRFGVRVDTARGARPCLASAFYAFSTTEYCHMTPLETYRDLTDTLAVGGGWDFWNDVEVIQTGCFD